MDTSSTRIDAGAPPPRDDPSDESSLGQEPPARHNDASGGALAPEVLERVAGGTDGTKLPVFGGGGGFSGGGSTDSW